MYSSIFNGITTDPAAMVIPLDDHMVHRGHGVFDTAAIMDGSVVFAPLCVWNFEEKRLEHFFCFLHSKTQILKNLSL